MLMTQTLFPDPSGPDDPAEPGKLCHPTPGLPDGSDGCGFIRLQLPPAQTSPQAIKSPLQIKGKGGDTQVFLIFISGSLWDVCYVHDRCIVDFERNKQKLSSIIYKKSNVF